ncbi:MAG: hypothetical protein HFG33_02940 [Bacilli bacterium]|nr:hypothetical protein [Bacilli bacterium]
MLLTELELIDIKGGASSGITSTFLNSVARLITTILDLGRTIGSSIARYKTKNYCY